MKFHDFYRSRVMFEWFFLQIEKLLRNSIFSERRKMVQIKFQLNAILLRMAKARLICGNRTTFIILKNKKK